ncbi:MAG: hypothetical protein HC875_15330 [Anaerolineales bacterium]|nr:hypothetical protein [Anaerolineales bacterium]
MVEMEDRHISFGQLQLYNNFCSFYYRLAYVDKLIPREQNIFTMFGDCVHKAIEQKIKIIKQIRKKSSVNYLKKGLKAFLNKKLIKLQKKKNTKTSLFL